MEKHHKVQIQLTNKPGPRPVCGDAAVMEKAAVAIAAESMATLSSVSLLRCILIMTEFKMKGCLQIMKEIVSFSYSKRLSSAVKCISGGFINLQGHVLQRPLELFKPLELLLLDWYVHKASAL